MRPNTTSARRPFRFFIAIPSFRFLLPASTTYRQLWHRPKGNHYVRRQGPILHVVVVEDVSFLDRSGTPEPVYLGPAHQPRENALPRSTMRKEIAEKVDEVRPLPPRPDARHLAF